MPYALHTQVAVDRSRQQIEIMLHRHGADRFGYQVDQNRRQAVVGFVMHGRTLRFDVPLPDPEDDRFRFNKIGVAKAKSVVESLVEQETRRRWRAVMLVIKAKLEAVETGITTFDSEFLAHFVLPGGVTVGETVIPQLEAAYKDGKSLPMLEAPKPRKGGA